MLNGLRKFVGRLHKDTSGAMSVEKIMIIAIIALPIVLALMFFRRQLIEWFSGQSQQLDPN